MCDTNSEAAASQAVLHIKKISENSGFILLGPNSEEFGCVEKERTK